MRRACRLEERGGPRSGTTLLEITLGAMLLAMLAGAAVMASNTMRGSYRAEVTVSMLDDKANLATAATIERLRGIDLDSAFPAPVNGTFSDWIDFQQVDLPTALTPSPPETLRFEYDPGDPDDGIDNDGDGLVDEGSLVWIVNPNQPGERRRILASSVAESLRGEIPGNLLDDNQNGLFDEKGVCFEFQPRRIVFHLTLAQRNPDGFVITRTVRRVIAPRNTPEPEAGP